MDFESVFEESGLRCYVVLNALFFRCGYVELPVGEIAVAVTQSLSDVDVHGGVTYSVVGESPVDGAEVLTIGFDTGHLGDAADLDAVHAAIDTGKLEGRAADEALCYAEFTNAGGYRHVWTLDETIVETRTLARHLAALARGV